MKNNFSVVVAAMIVAWIFTSAYTLMLLWIIVAALHVPAFIIGAALFVGVVLLIVWIGVIRLAVRFMDHYSGVAIK